MAERGLRVGIDARPALFGRSGFGRVVRESCRALRARGRVELVPWGGAWQRPREDADLPGVCGPRLPARLIAALSALGLSVETWCGALDVFHHTDLVFAPAGRAREVLTVYDLVYLADDDWHEPGFAAAALRRLRPRLAAARAVVVPCARVADDLLARGLAPATKVHVAPLGCDHVDPRPGVDDEERVRGLLRACGLQPGERRLLVLGTREPRKNQAAVLAAHLARGRADERLIFAGAPGWGVPELEARLADPRVAGSPRAPGGDGATVAVLDEVSEDDLSALLRTVDAVVYPSLAEGFGLPVFEALRCGRPVLTARGTPMADLAGEAVLAVDPRDPGELARGLDALLDDPRRAAELSAAGPAAVAGSTWASHAEALEHVYARAVS